MARISLRNFIQFSLISDRRKLTLVKNLLLAKGGPDFWESFNSSIKRFFRNNEVDISDLNESVNALDLQSNQQNAYAAAIDSFGKFYRKFLAKKNVSYLDDPLRTYWHYNGTFVSLGMSLALIVNNRKTYIKYLYDPQKTFTKRDAYYYLEMIKRVYTSENNPLVLILRLDNGSFYSSDDLKEDGEEELVQFLQAQADTYFNLVARLS